ncbi:MAG: hypothetical protein APF77_06975 [Clostridia bacterium BRH_c25]|nr:MAG: hypothetical protein APF77_06975 [Clostridia bacterium BRH_c25]
MCTYVKASKIYCVEGVKSGFLKLEDDKFAGIYEKIPYSEAYTDYDGYSIIPGIFDTHNHGIMGYSVKNSEAVDYLEEIRGYIKALPAYGVTMVFPTIMDGLGSKEIAQAADEKSEGAAAIAGIHSEGPYLNRVGEKGRPKPYPEVSIKLVENMIEESGGKVKLFALAPEIPGTDKILHYLLQKNITAAIAHSNCSAEMARKAIDEGITVATHLGNVMTGIHHRDIGILGACLLDKRVDCELVCDGIHICNDMLELILNVKDNNRIMIISDGTSFGGLNHASGMYNLGGNLLKVERDGRVLDEDGRINGSSKTVMDGMRNLVKNLKIPLESVWPMASLNPCIKYGFSDRKGSIESGKDADFVVIDDEFNVISTFIAGKKVFSKEQKQWMINPDFEKLHRLD